MGRTLSGTINSILALAERDIQWTLDLTFPDATSLKFATAPLTITGRGTYPNDLESVSEIRQTLENPTDTTSVGLQNKDRVLGLHVAEHWQKWRRAEAVIGRYYRDRIDSPTLTDWLEMFRGSVQQPNANDLQVTFDVLVDTLTPGEIVCNHGLAPQCPFLFKHAKTCGYSGVETLCDHNLKSLGGCDGRANSHHYGGMEHRYNPDVSVPGTGGNNEDPGDIDPPCPRLDQYVLVKGVGGCIEPKMVCFLTELDSLWNPFIKQFRRVKSARVERRQPIWEILMANGAAGWSSHLHPVIEDLRDRRGRAVRFFQTADRRDTAVTITDSQTLSRSRVVHSRDTRELGDVMRIEMEAELEEEKIYCYGDNPQKLIVCHNLKGVDLPE